MKCPDCGGDLKYIFETEPYHLGIEGPRPVSHAICPGCGHKELMK